MSNGQIDLVAGPGYIREGRVVTLGRRQAQSRPAWRHALLQFAYAHIVFNLASL